MDKNQLRNFVLLAHALNFSTVAKQQFISQPALTNQISKLEAELGVRLFHRSKHGVSLTYAGSEFYRYASEILDGIDRAERRMDDIAKGRTGFLKISAVTSNEYQVTRHVAEFSRRYGDIEISLDSGTGTQQIMAINKKAFDVYFSFSSLLDASGTLETLLLESDRYAVYINSRDADRLDGLEFSRLSGLTHLVESRAEGPFLLSQIQSLMLKLGLSLDSTVYYPSTAAILMGVQAGLGYAILPSKMNLGAMPEDIRVIPIPGDEAVIQNAVGWHRDGKNIAAQKFIQLVREMNGAGA